MDQLRGEKLAAPRPQGVDRERPLPSHLHDGDDQAAPGRDGKRSGKGIKPAGVLADFVEVDPQFERATEEFLHNELEFVVMKRLGRGRSRNADLCAPIWRAARRSWWKRTATHLPVAGPGLPLKKLTEHLRLSQRPHGPGWHAVADCELFSS